MTATPLYSIGTWDTDRQAYTPQAGLAVPAFNITIWQLRQAIRELRSGGYTVHYVRSASGDHANNDWAVLIERTDGMSERKIRKSWRR